jgi:hypothetical protein
MLEQRVLDRGAPRCILLGNGASYAKRFGIGSGARATDYQEHRSFAVKSERSAPCATGTMELPELRVDERCRFEQTEQIPPLGVQHRLARHARSTGFVG